MKTRIQINPTIPIIPPEIFCFFIFSKPLALWYLLKNNLLLTLFSLYWKNFNIDRIYRYKPNCEDQRELFNFEYLSINKNHEQNFKIIQLFRIYKKCMC